MKIRNRQQLADFVNHGNPVKYLFFWGHRKPASGVAKTCFSQWYDAPFKVDKHQFLTAEHYMMYQKAMLFEDHQIAKKLLAATNPGEAKELGRQVRGFDQEKWEQHRIEIVVDGNVAKFNAHEELKTFLLGTGKRILVEASPVDTIWGIGLGRHNPKSQDPFLWRGLNLLGFALTAVREKIREQSKGTR